MVHTNIGCSGEKAGQECAKEGCKQDLELYHVRNTCVNITKKGECTTNDYDVSGIISDHLRDLLNSNQQGLEDEEMPTSEETFKMTVTEAESCWDETRKRVYSEMLSERMEKLWADPIWRHTVRQSQLDKLHERNKELWADLQWRAMTGQPKVAFTFSPGLWLYLIDPNTQEDSITDAPPSGDTQYKEGSKPVLSQNSIAVSKAVSFRSYKPGLLCTGSCPCWPLRSSRCLSSSF